MNIELTDKAVAYVAEYRQPDWKPRAYEQIISEATGRTERHELERLEDCVRNDIFHSTLNHLHKARLKAGAREAARMLVIMGELAPINATEQALYDSSEATRLELAALEKEFGL